jgi:ankyrin repeat protein
VAIDASSVHEEASSGWNINSGEAQKLLADAAMRGDADVVRAFITEGADVSTRVAKVSLLQRARGVEVVKMLIAAGADVNATSKEYFGPPLSFAAKLGDADSMKVLLDAGAKVNGRSPDGETALMEAAKAGDPVIVGLLLRAGADAKVNTTSGEDALKYADYGLDRQRIMAKHPDAFDEPLVGYEQKYKQIQEMLTAAGAERTK